MHQHEWDAWNGRQARNERQTMMQGASKRRRVPCPSNDSETPASQTPRNAASRGLLSRLFGARPKIKFCPDHRSRPARAPTRARAFLLRIKVCFVLTCPEFAIARGNASRRGMSNHSRRAGRRPDSLISRARLYFYQNERFNSFRSTSRTRAGTSLRTGARLPSLRLNPLQTR